MKVFGLSKLVWSIIFFIVQIFNFAFLVGAMNYDYWFSQELNYYIEGFYYDSYHLQGKLIKPNSNIAQDCTTVNTYQECYDNYSEFGFDALEKWYSAGVAYIFFDTLGAILVVIAAVFIALDAFKFKPLKKIINLFTTSILMFVYLYSLHRCYVLCQRSTSQHQHQKINIITTTAAATTTRETIFTFFYRCVWQEEYY